MVENFYYMLLIQYLYDLLVVVFQYPILVVSMPLHSIHEGIPRSRTLEPTECEDIREGRRALCDGTPAKPGNTSVTIGPNT